MKTAGTGRAAAPTVGRGRADPSTANSVVPGSRILGAQGGAGARGDHDDDRCECGSGGVLAGQQPAGVHRPRLLRELDRRGTLAAVARALSYSPSAISRQLSQLETETGVPLPEPAGRGVRLTPQARILVEHTEAILERLEEAEADRRASLAEVRGTLRVASFQSVLLAVVPEVLTRLAERHPGLRVEITHQEEGPAFAGLLAHDFDVALGEEYPGTAHPPVAGARTRLLANDELFTVFPAHGRYAAGGPWIFDPADTGPGRWARNACREAGFEPDVRYVASDLLLQIRLAETGHAAAVIPACCWPPCRARPRGSCRCPDGRTAASPPACAPAPAGTRRSARSVRLCVRPSARRWRHNHCACGRFVPHGGLAVSMSSRFSVLLPRPSAAVREPWSGSRASPASASRPWWPRPCPWQASQSGTWGGPEPTS